MKFSLKKSCFFTLLVFLIASTSCMTPKVLKVGEKGYSSNQLDAVELEVVDDSYDGQLLRVDLRVTPNRSIDNRLVGVRVRVLDDAALMIDQTFKLTSLLKEARFSDLAKSGAVLSKGDVYDLFITLLVPHFSSYQVEMFWGEGAIELNSISRDKE